MMRPAPLFLVLLLAPGGAQDEDYPQKNTAHVKAHPAIDEVVTRATTLAASGRFVEALAIYDEAVEKYSDRVVPLDRTRAIGVWDYVQGQIGSWPEEGKAAYRRRADPLAEHLFLGAKRSRDVDALDRLIDQYPFSSGVADALALIGNLRLDAGENAAAADAFTRLLDREGAGERPVVFSRLGLALSREGRKAELLALAQRAEREIPGARAEIGGKELGVAAYLRELAAATPEGKSGPAPLALPAWEMISGGPAGWAPAEPGVELAKAAWTEAIGLPRLDGDEDSGLPRRNMALQPTLEFRPLFPVVCDGILYVHNGLTLSAYNFFARQPERLWQFKVPFPAGEVMFDNRTIYAPSVHDGRVFANLISSVGGAEDQLGYVRVKFPFPRRGLYALDAYTGKLLWKLGGELKSELLEKNATFATGPTPDGDRLYVGAIRQVLSTDPFEHYVLCLDAATGKILWSSFVASGGTEINLFGNSTRESMGTPVAVTADAVYYGTNHGVVSALDKKSGRIRWTYRYRQLSVMPTRSVYVMKNRLEWVNSPPVVAQGVAVFTPTDSHFLVALDAATGMLRWDRPRSQDVRTLYGVKDSTLVLGGDRLELCDLRSGQATTPPMGEELRGTGRGVVAADGIYVAGADKLRKVGWDGTWDEALARRWPGGLGDGGNLVVVDGAVVLASQGAIQVFFDRRDQERTIVEALERAPDDPALLYRGALRFLQAGDSVRAADLLTKAVKRSAAGRTPEDARLHRAALKRLFAVSMEAGRVELQGGRPDEAAERFAAARRNAPDASARIEASVALARVHLVRKEDAAAVAEYQRLLLEHGEENVEGVRVFDLGRNAIGAILATVGREAYAVPEAAAQAMLAAARRDGSADALQQVFRLYPNSEAAETALFEAAAVLGRLGRADDQIAVLRQFLREAPASTKLPQAHVNLVLVLEKKGHTASSGALLRRLLRLYPDAVVEEGGKTLVAREFAEQRLKNRLYERVSATPPLPRIPEGELASAFEYRDEEYPEGVPLRTGGLPPAGAEEFVLMHYAGPKGAAVKAIEAPGRVAWHAELRSQIRFASYLEEALLVADDQTVLRLNPVTGAVAWRYESLPRIRGYALSGPFLIGIVDDPGSRLVAIDAIRGVVAWSQPFEGTATSRVYPSGEAVVFLTSQPFRIQRFEAETGRPLLQDAGFKSGLSGQVVHVSDELLILHLEGKYLEAYDLGTGGLRWKAMLERTSTRGLELGPEGLVFLGTQRVGGGGDERLFMMTISLKSGKILRRKDTPELGDPRFMLVDGERAYVVTREPDKTISVRGVQLADFSVLWNRPLGGKDATTLLSPLLAKDRALVGVFQEDAQAKYAYGTWLLDKEGRVVQNISSAFTFDRPPVFGLTHNRLVYSVENKVVVYR